MKTREENPTSRNIPLPMQREIRQRCGFGCVICGMPLYEYDHMVGWAQAQQHIPEEITLLCDQHHKERTNDLLPIEKVREADADPYNKRAGVSKPYDLHFAGEFASVELGGNRFWSLFQGDGSFLVPLSVDGTTLIGFIWQDKHLLLNLIAFDEYNRPILQIKNNQLYYSMEPWDIQLVGTKLTVREALRKILIEIEFRPSHSIAINRGRFLRNGVEIVVRPANILIKNNNMIIAECVGANVPAGVVIGYHEQDLPAMFRGNVNRYARVREDIPEIAGDEPANHGATGSTPNDTP